MFVILDKAKSNTGNIRGLNLAAVKPTTVQVTSRYSIIGDKKCIICCTLPGLTEAIYILFIVCFMHCIYLHCKYVTILDKDQDK
jgi:hypothetical protein